MATGNQVPVLAGRDHFYDDGTSPPVPLARPLDQANRDPGWEYLCFGAELARGLAEHQAEFEDYKTGFVRPTGERVDDPLAHMQELLNENAMTVGNVTRLLSPETLESAFGTPGEPGDEVKIRHVAAGLVEVYATMIAWGQRVRGASVPSVWEPVYWALSKNVDMKLRQIQDFSSGVSASVEKVVGDLRAGREPTDTVTLTLNFSNDPEAVKEFNDALQTVRDGSKASAAPTASGLGCLSAMWNGFVVLLGLLMLVGMFYLLAKLSPVAAGVTGGVVVCIVGGVLIANARNRSPRGR